MASMNVTKINHAAVAVRDRKVSLKFYRDLLGLRVIASMVDSPNIVWMQMPDGTMLHLIEPRDGQAPPPAPTGAYHNAFQVDDFDNALKLAKNAGLDIDGPGERHDGQRYFFVKDPDGNRVEIATSGGHRKTSRKADEQGYTK